VGRKAIGSIFMGGGLARQMNKPNTTAHSFLEIKGLFELPEVMNHEIIVLFWYLQRICPLLSILYVCPAMGSGMDNFCCAVLGHGRRNGAYSSKTKDRMTRTNPKSQWLAFGGS
jgi:hypothetical protein